LRLSLRAISTSNKINPESLVFKYSSAGPSVVKYTSDHEWIAQHEDGTAFIGITKYASDALGDATFVELPEVEEEFSEGDSIGSVESVKSSSEIYAPVDAKIIEVNTVLEEKPQLINLDPLGDGYLAKISVEKSIDEYEHLLTEEQYEASLEQDE
jgi:glycine cleavage system H protein